MCMYGSDASSAEMREAGMTNAFRYTWEEYIGFPKK